MCKTVRRDHMVCPCRPWNLLRGMFPKSRCHHLHRDTIQQAVRQNELAQKPAVGDLLKYGHKRCCQQQSPSLRHSVLRNSCHTLTIMWHSVIDGGLLVKSDETTIMKHRSLLTPTLPSPTSFGKRWPPCFQGCRILRVEGRANLGLERRQPFGACRW